MTLSFNKDFLRPFWFGLIVYLIFIFKYSHFFIFRRPMSFDKYQKLIYFICLPSFLCQFMNHISRFFAVFSCTNPFTAFLFDLSILDITILTDFISSVKPLFNYQSSYSVQSIYSQPVASSVLIAAFNFPRFDFLKKTPIIK